jgi:hypothetical protein
VLAELAKTSPGHDSAFADWITDLLDRRVLRVRDRVIVRDLTGPPLTLRPGGPLEETVEQALKAIGDQSVDLDRGTLGSAGYREGDEEEAFDLG